MDDLDRTQKESQDTIARVDQALSQAGEMLKRSGDMLGDNANVPDLARGYVSRQSPEMRSEFEREVKQLREEIERDLPRQEAKRQVKVRPTRQMV